MSSIPSSITIHQSSSSPCCPTTTILQNSLLMVTICTCVPVTTGTFQHNTNHYRAVVVKNEKTSFRRAPVISRNFSATYNLSLNIHFLSIIIFQTFCLPGTLKLAEKLASTFFRRFNENQVMIHNNLS